MDVLFESGIWIWFTLLGTPKKTYISPSRCVQVDVFFRLRHFGGIHSLRNSVINPWKTEKPKRWSQSENMNLRELTTERPKQMVQLLISSDLLELSTEPPLRVSFFILVSPIFRWGKTFDDSWGLVGEMIMKGWVISFDFYGISSCCNHWIPSKLWTQ